MQFELSSAVKFRARRSTNVLLCLSPLHNRAPFNWRPMTFTVGAPVWTFRLKHRPASTRRFRLMILDLDADVAEERDVAESLREMLDGDHA